MTGTKSGGKKAAAKNKELYGPDFYERIGSKGGKKGRDGGFGSEKVGKDGLTGFERASIAGKLGGERSRRGPAKKKPVEKVQPRSRKRISFSLLRFGKNK